MAHEPTRPRAESSEHGVELHAVLLQAAPRWRERLPDGVQFRRRLDGRGHFVAGESGDVEALSDALLQAAVQRLDARSSLELSLIPVRIPPGAPWHRLVAGDWLRLSLRWPRSESRTAVAFDLPGSFGGSIDELLQRFAALAHHCVLPEHLCHTIHFPVRHIDLDRAILTPAGGFGRILYVDDEPMVLQVHRQSIESLGYEVVPMESAAEALALFRAAPHVFDLVISDQSMPHMDGNQLARAIRELDTEIPILLSTGLATPGARALAESARVNAILEKPFTLEEMALSLRDALGRRRREARS